MNNQEFKWDDGSIADFLSDIERGIINTIDGGYHGAIEKFKSSKQKPLEYEILEVEKKDKCYILRYKNGICIWRSDNIPFNGTTKLDSLVMEDCYITKVARVSDSCIFSIGDITNQGRITGFRVNSIGIFVQFEGGTREFSFSLLQKAEPKKQPILFKTADGVDNRAGDNYWKVWENFLCTKYQSSEGGDYPPLYIKTSFSAKESAESYITLNRPHLSVQDIVTAFSHVFYDKNSFMQELIELAKSKNK